MTVAALLKSKPYNVAIVAPTDTVTTVVRALAQRRIGAAVVMAEGTLVGIISERDVLRALAADGPAALERQVEGLMVRSVKTCAPEATVDEAASMMRAGHFRHLPVVDRNGRLVGLISIRDLLNSKVDQREAEVNSLRGYVTGAYVAGGPG